MKRNHKTLILACVMFPGLVWACTMPMSQRTGEQRARMVLNCRALHVSLGANPEECNEELVSRYLRKD